MFVDNVKSCSFSQWYKKFAHVTFESVTIKTCEDFRNYLLADGIYLPKSCKFPDRQPSNDDEEDWSDEEDEVEVPEFKDIDQKIRAGLNLFDKKVFVKMNWSSPRDAFWIHSGGSKCQSLADVYLLLKSSDFIVHDLTEPFSKCEDKENVSQSPIQYELVLRKWVDINPSHEFRCFVFNDCLTGICQRDACTYYEHIGENADEITEDIKRFFRESICRKFKESNYVFDIYRPRRGHVILIDFNPYGEVTDSLLFDWDDLRDLESTHSSNALKLKFVSHGLGIQPQSARIFAMPIDALS